MISAILLTIMRDKGFGLNALSYLSQLSSVIAGDFTNEMFSLIGGRDNLRAKTPMIQHKTNRSLTFPLGRWEKVALYHWKWFTPSLPISYMPDMAKFTQSTL